MPDKVFCDFYFRDKVTMSDRTPYNFPHGNDDGHSVHFQRQNDSKISMLIKACRSLSVKNCHAKGRELTPRMYSCGELIVGYEKFPQFARCFDDKIGQLSDNLLDLRVEGTVLDLSARTFWRKKFSWEQIFASWCLIVKIAKISASRKFPTVQ